MLIKVIKTQKAASCPMGIKTKIYEAKEEPQEIHDSLAEVFISEGWGVDASGDSQREADRLAQKAAEEKARKDEEEKKAKEEAEKAQEEEKAAEELKIKEELIKEAEELGIEDITVEDSIDEIKDFIQAAKEEIEEEKIAQEKKAAEEKALAETKNKAIQKSPENKSLAGNKNINNKKGK